MAVRQYNRQHLIFVDEVNIRDTHGGSDFLARPLHGRTASHDVYGALGTRAGARVGLWGVVRCAMQGSIPLDFVKFGPVYRVLPFFPGRHVSLDHFDSAKSRKSPNFVS